MRLTGVLSTIFVCLASSAFAQDHDLGQLTKQLQSGSLDDQTKSARMLGEMGHAAAAAVPALVKSLDSNNPGLKYEAANSLGLINADPKLAVPAVGKLLKDPEPLLQLTAIETLQRFGREAKSFVPQLKELLNDKEPMLAVSAARAMMEIEAGSGPNVSAAQSVLIEKGLKSDRPDVVSAAIHGLAVIGNPAVPAIQALVTGHHDQSCVNACDALAAIGAGAEKAVEQLVLATKTSDVTLRWHAASALGDIGPAAKTASTTLIGLLSDPDTQVRLSAERSLVKIGKGAVPALVESLKNEKLHSLVSPIIGEIGPDAKEAVPGLAAMLRSRDPQTRREAILALAAIGPEASQTAPDLIKLFKVPDDKQFPNRPAAAFALGKMGVKDAVPVLKEGMADKDNAVLRLASAWALLQIEPGKDEYAKSAVPLLISALEFENPDVRREAARTLGRIGTLAKAAVPALQQRLNDTAAPVRRESLIALAEIASPTDTLVAEIIRVINEAEPSLRPIGCYALGRLGSASKTAVPLLRRILYGRDTYEKTVAAWALVQISPDAETVQTATPLLVTALKHAEMPEFRMEAAKALGKIGANSAAVRDALTGALKDSDESVRKAAEQALKQSK